MAGAFGVAAFTGCSAIRGFHSRLADHDALSPGHRGIVSKSASSVAWNAHSTERSQAEGFLSVPSPATSSSFRGGNFDFPDEDEIEGSLDANAEEAQGEVSIEEVVEEAAQAAEDAHGAAEVAIAAEIVAVIGTLGAIVSGWIGYKMDPSQLPEEAKVPSGDVGFPPELLRPPPPELQLRSAGDRGSLGQPRRSTPAGPGSAPGQPSAMSGPEAD